jgi:hypothetical protein
MQHELPGSILAAELLNRAGMHGYQHAIDSVVAAMALRRVRPVLL